MSIADPGIEHAVKSRDQKRTAPDRGSVRYSAASCATVGWVPATVARRMSRGCDWS